MATVLHLSSANTTQNTNLTRYYMMGDGGSTGQSSESVVQMTYRSAGTLSNLYTRVNTNSINTGSSFVVRSRKGAANQNQVVTYGALGVNEQEDTTHTDSVSAGDLWNYSAVTANSAGTVTVTNMSTLFAASSNTVRRFNAQGSLVAGASTTYYGYLSCVASLGSGVEPDKQINMLTAGTFKNGLGHPTTARATATTLTFRKNTANGNITMSLTGGSTSIFEDTTHTDTVSVNDLCNWTVITGTGTDNFVCATGIEFETTDSTNQYHGMGATTQNASVTNNMSVQGRANSATETDEQAKCGVTGVASNLETNITANTILAQSDLYFRKNAGNGNQHVPIGLLTTGLLTDGSNTDSITTTDEINHQIVTGAGGTSLTWQYIAMKLSPTAVAGFFSRYYYDMPRGVMNV